MSQVFHPSINSFAKASVVGAGLGVVFLILAATIVERSPYVTHLHDPIPQPIPFSHQHHAGGLGIDCRYCHSSVENSATAGIPALSVCMTCHSQIWRDSPTLAPVRDSYAGNLPVEWTRVHNLPDYAYFQHDIHVNKGIGCETCHGRVDQMPLTSKANTLHMEWCLECHREPERYLRPKEHVFEMGYKPTTQQQQLGADLMNKYSIDTHRIEDCVTCHR